MKILLFSTLLQRAIAFANAPLNLWLFSTLLYPLSFGLSALSAQAQIVPDGTLSSTVSSSDGQNFTIDNGDRTGNNLFHSFDTFSIPTNGSAVFEHPTDVENIFSRVTGPSLSNIDGLLQTTGTTNLFLLNPNGIIFGPNAKLDIAGSFTASTADSFIFADGTEFSATAAEPPLLSISVPVGLQLNQPQGNIESQEIESVV
ncbi:MAG: filamentous hemagglutinin N-terminal domain-containing protein [Cyanobacteria bacterium J06636_28]